MSQDVDVAREGRWRWGRLALVAMAFGVGFADPMTAQLASPAPVEWGLFPEACPPPPSAVAVPCGDYGDFYFGPVSGQACAVAAGIEQPPVYTAGSFAGTTPGGEEPPCANGECFGPPGGAGGNEPWIAVLDWDNPHGWTIGWTALRVAGIGAHLYALDGIDLAGFLGSEIGDAHLLARLCELTHAVDEQGVTPPVTVNMSFGRLLVEGEDAENGASCDPDTLSCQVGRVLDHLSAAGVTAAAAAGNHRRSLFPAAYDTVLAVGSLDLAMLGEIGAIVPSWETPATFAALAPGYGVCLGFDDGGTGAEPLWPAPPGASYASAIFAGWLADHLLVHAVPDPLAIDWAPRWSPVAGCYVLSDLAPPHCNAEANRILARTLDPALPNCWKPRAGPTLTATAALTPEPEVWRRQPSLVERNDDQLVTAPESDPCVPCIVNRPDSPTTAAAKSMPADPQLDLSASSPLPPALTIEWLYLRSEEGFHLLLDRAFPTDAAKLDSLAAAAVDRLVLVGARSLLVPGRQASLFYRLCDAASECYWSSFPILDVD